MGKIIWILLDVWNNSKWISILMKGETVNQIHIKKGNHRQSDIEIWQLHIDEKENDTNDHSYNTF